MMYGWGYLYAHGLVTPALVREDLIAGAVALAIVLGFVIGVLVERFEAVAEMRHPLTTGGATPSGGRRVA